MHSPAHRLSTNPRSIIMALIALAFWNMTTTAQAHEGESHDATARAIISADDPYSVAHRCVAIRPVDNTKLGLTLGSTVNLSDSPSSLKLQPAGLGEYLLYSADKLLLTDSDSGLSAKANPTVRSVWTVKVADPKSFYLTSKQSGHSLAISAGQLAVNGTPARFQFEEAKGCADFPEAELNVNPSVPRPDQIGKRSLDTVRGINDAHMHAMNEVGFLGGSIHCGSSFSPLGVTVALAKCEDNSDGSVAIREILNLVLKSHPTTSEPGTGKPYGLGVPGGWPDFSGWPQWSSYNDEQSYYKWIERAWLGGLRLMTVDLIDNGALCKAMPAKKTDCNENKTQKAQLIQLEAMRDYIDAQSGGPGKGWLQIVKDPFEARELISRGKLAVVIGIEGSEPFDCGIWDGQAKCTRESLKRELDWWYDHGLRSTLLVNKFDNAFTGVTGDKGLTGTFVNIGNKIGTNKFWDMRPCKNGQTPDVFQFQKAPDTQAFNNAVDATNFEGNLPVYPAGNLCNVRGLTDLGRYAIDLITDKKMLIDFDHMSTKARDEALDVIEAKQYSGVVSSHSWSDPESYKRICKLGGHIAEITTSTPDAAVKTFNWRKSELGSNFSCGYGTASDIEGYNELASPGSQKIAYPFKSPFDGRAFDRNRTGDKSFDFNNDGMAHYGMLADWNEAVRVTAGSNEFSDKIAKGAESYLQTWERAQGIASAGCVAASRASSAKGKIAKVKLGAKFDDVLRAAGQPTSRVRNTYQYCITTGRKQSTLHSAFDSNYRAKLLLSFGKGFKVGKRTVGNKTSGIAKISSERAAGLWVSNTCSKSACSVYMVRGNKIVAAGLTTRKVAKSKTLLRRLVNQIKPI